MEKVIQRVILIFFTLERALMIKMLKGLQFYVYSSSSPSLILIYLLLLNYLWDFIPFENIQVKFNVYLKLKI